MAAKQQSPKQEDQAPAGSAEYFLAQADGDYARAEKIAAAQVEIPPVSMLLLAVVAVVALLSQLLSYSAHVKALDVLLYSSAVLKMHPAAQERLFVVFVLATVLATFGFILLQKHWLGYVAWVLSGFASFFGIFAAWMRQSRGSGEYGIGLGLALMIMAMMVLAVLLSIQMNRKSQVAGQLAAMREEYQLTHLDDVAQAQLEARAQAEAILEDERRKRRRR